MITSRTHDRFSLNIERRPFTTGCRVKNNDSEGFEITRYLEQNTKDDKLNAGHVYEVMVSYITDMGESAPSGTSVKFNLPATSGSRGLTVVSSLHITWLPPAKTALGVIIEDTAYDLFISGALSNAMSQCDTIT